MSCLQSTGTALESRYRSIDTLLSIGIATQPLFGMFHARLTTHTQRHSLPLLMPRHKTIFVTTARPHTLCDTHHQLICHVALACARESTAHAHACPRHCHKPHASRLTPPLGWLLDRPILCKVEPRVGWVGASRTERSCASRARSGVAAPLLMLSRRWAAHA